MTDSGSSDSHSSESGQVWYAGYGSNLLRQRFEHYLTGGSYAGAPQRSQHAGARDSTLPTDDRAWRVPHGLRFAGESTRWSGGGVAFLDPGVGSGEAVVRLYRITAEQFGDVAAQENGLSPGDLNVDVDALVSNGGQDISNRWYGRGLYLGDVEGAPVVTFTARVNVEPVTSPSSAYAEVVARGLLECGLTGDEVVSYLLAAPGVDLGWTQPGLVELVELSTNN